MSTIDYGKLNDRIVEQAYMGLTESQVKALIQGKIERALAESRARELKPLTK